MSNADLDKFLGECPTHKKLPWKIGAMESGQVAIDSDDGKEVTGWIDPEDACLILNQQQRIEELERERDDFYMDYRMKCDEQTKSLCVERDALQADNARLREVLVKHVAPYLGHKEVYDEALATTPEQSLAAYRNKVIEECAALCDRFAAREMHPAECASAIRAMKED